MIADPCRFGSTGLNKTVIYGTGRKYKYDLYGYVSVQLVFLPDDAQPRVDDLPCPHCLQAPTPTNVVFTTATIAGGRRGTDRQSDQTVLGTNQQAVTADPVPGEGHWAGQP